jgi:hypothetical protein
LKVKLIVMKENLENTNNSQGTYNKLARIVLAAFLLTFMYNRIGVFLIMSRTIPDLYVHIKGTHIHHLNYGIFLLSAVGAYLLFKRPANKALSISAGLYGIGMAMTFDEFGMWLHLGGSYWQRASWDAMVVLATVFTLIAFAPSLKKFKPRHWITGAILTITLVIFVLLLVQSFKYAGKKLVPDIKRIESTNPK